MIRRLVLAAIVFAPVPAPAQSPDMNATMPACGSRMDGQVMCRFGGIYECRLAHDGSGSPGRWRWTANLLRSCEAALPADLNPQQNRLPDGFTYAPSYGGEQGSGSAGVGRAGDRFPRRQRY